MIRKIEVVLDYRKNEVNLLKKTVLKLTCTRTHTHTCTHTHTHTHTLVYLPSSDTRDDQYEGESNHPERDHESDF